MYDVVTLQTIDYTTMSSELQLPIEHIRVYFSNYALYKNFPIRTLTFEEENLVKAIKQIKLMTDAQLRNLIEEYEIDLTEISKDNLLIERKVARYEDEERYIITRKYQHFILEPAVLYGNVEAPLTKPLTLNEIVVLMSNMAIGLSKNNEAIDPKVRLSALSKIADIYATSKILENSNQSIDEEVIEDMSPAQLNELIKMIEQPHLRVALEKKPESPKKEEPKQEIPKKTRKPRTKKLEPAE